MGVCIGLFSIAITVKIYILGIQELDETGSYTPVEVQEASDVTTGGILQLKQGTNKILSF